MKPGRGRRVELGAGIVVEYLPSRSVLCLFGRERKVDLSLVELLAQLGVPARDVVPSRQYLLFAGHDGAAGGGITDLVDIYVDEQQAREQFQRLRLAPGSQQGWAHLVAMCPDGRLEPVSWFGRVSGSPRWKTHGALETTAAKPGWRVRLTRSQPPQASEQPLPPATAPRQTGKGQHASDETAPTLAAFSTTGLDGPEPPTVVRPQVRVDRRGFPRRRR